MKNYILFLIGMLLVPFSQGVENPPVSLEVSGLHAVLDNGLITVEFKEDGSAVRIIKAGKNIIANLSGTARDPSKTRSAYLDYYVKGVKDFIPERLEVISNNPDMAHIAYIDQQGLLRLEYHLIVRKGISGIYSYVVAENTGKDAVTVSELRNVYRFDPAQLDHLYNGLRQGKPLLYAQLEALPKVQDETWRLPDGEVYSKYDYAGYQRATPFWGVFGHGYGAWLIHASQEYFSGDALKQDLLVHQDAIILNYMTGAHLGTPDMVAPPGWKKCYGPWLLYINQGDEQQIVEDARRQSFTETVSWPYLWLNDARYPTKRTQVVGRVIAKQPMTVVLSSSLEEPFDLQTRGYLYEGKTNPDGSFRIPHVRPGTYQLAIYANQGTQPGVLLQQRVTVQGEHQQLPDMAIPEAKPVIWAIGQADRQAGEFRLGNQMRNYRWQNAVPANLTYVIGQSDYQQDWYYAQTRPGRWDILFTLHPKPKTYLLTLALAATSNSGMDKPTSPKLAVVINGVVVDTLTYENDKALYRGALQSGRYQLARIPLSSAWLKNGNNRLSLELKGGSIMYDIITLSEE